MHSAPRSARTVPRPLLPLLLLLAFGSLGGFLFLLPGRGGPVRAAWDSSHHEATLAAQATAGPTLTPRPTSTWDGGGADNSWTTPQNWEGDEAPQPGDDLVFPPGAAQLSSVSTLDRFGPNSITITGSGYDVGGANINLGSGGLSATYASGSSTVHLALFMPAGGTTIRAQQAGAELRIESEIVVGDGPVTFDGAGTIRLSTGADIEGPFGVTKGGSGLLVLTAVSSYGGPTMVTAGTLQLNSSIATSAVTVEGGTLSGGGEVSGGLRNISQSLTLTDGAVSPGNTPGTTNVLTTGPVTLAGGTYGVDVGDASTGSRYDQLAVTGSVTLDGAGLVVKPVPSNPPSPGQEFIIVDNDGADAVVGTFAGLPEGATVMAGSTELRISYVGGDGNDVTLTAAAPEPPTITSITPNYGPAEGDMMVTIRGSGFSTDQGGTRFVLDNGNVAFVSVQCSTTDTCAATSIAQSGVVAGDAAQAFIFAEVGGQRSAAGPLFVWYGEPVLDSIAPASGPPMGGNTVTLSGNTFPLIPNAGTSPAGPVTVRFGTAPATVVACTTGTYPSIPSTCTVTAPAGAPGSAVDVTIETPGGVSNARQYAYARPRPEVTSINPTRGRQAGNDRVTIRGRNLAPPTSAAAGPGPGGGSGDNDGLIGDGGLVGGGVGSGDPGADEGNATLIQFGTAVATGVTCNADGTECTAVSPSGPMGGGTVPVRVTVNGEQSEDTPADDFTYVAPPVATNDSATTSFATAVAINVLANDSGDEIEVTAVTQPPNGSADINADGTVTYTPNTGFSGTDTFTYTITDAVDQTDSATVTVTVGFPAPTIISLTPTSGSTNGGTTVTISGSGFQQGATVTFGGTAATVTSVSATTIVVTTPAHAPSTVDVTVTNPDSQAATLPSAYTYTVPAPIITSITPAGGPEPGGTAVTITGQNLTSPFGPTSVSFGGVPASNVRCTSATTCEATSPPGTGTAGVRVTVLGRSSPDTPADDFTYRPPPRVTGLNPDRGPEAGGTQVTITGEGFVPGQSSITFGGAPAQGVSCASATQCQAVSPPGMGTVNVRVAVAGETSPDTPAATLTYEPPPPQPMRVTGQVWRQIPPIVGEGQTEGTVVPVVGGVVEALVGNTVCGQGVNDPQGRVALVVAADPPARGCGRPGVVVTFRVNGAVVGETVAFRSGGHASVTLILSPPAPPPRR